MNRCKEVRDILGRVRSILYKVLPKMEDIGAETVSVELGRGSVALDEVEDDLTRLAADAQSAVDQIKEARLLWITATQVPADVDSPPETK